MSREHEFENEEMFEQPEFNYYYAPPMFNYSAEDEDEYMRSCCHPMMPYMMPGMQSGMMPAMQSSMMPAMQPGMMMPETAMPGMMMPETAMPGMQPQTQQGASKPNTVGLEPGMEAGLQSPSLPAMGINPATSQQQATVFNQGFLQAYLNKLIGRFVRIEFLIGTTTMTDRTGTIVEVGVNYIVLRDLAGSDVVCDLYAIKFVTVFPQQQQPR